MSTAREKSVKSQGQETIYEHVKPLGSPPLSTPIYTKDTKAFYPVTTVS